MTLGDSLDFHHIGVACESLAPEMSTWTALGYRLEGGPFIDHAQGIRGQFVVGNGIRLELLEPIGDSSTLEPWLKRRIKFYHLGYLTSSFDATMEGLIGSGATVARSPMMSAHFEARIAFLMLPNLAMVELIDIGHERVTPAPEAM